MKAARLQTEFKSFPRPYRKLVIDGWRIDRGVVVKVGTIYLFETDNSEGSVSIRNCVVKNTLFPSNITDSNEQMLTAAICILVLSREDVQTIIKYYENAL